MPIQTILTIAGFDPSSGAGITADLAVIAAHGFFGTSAITALTVQSTIGVKASHVVSAQILDETLDYLLQDLPPVGIKLGMLGSFGNVQAVVEHLKRLRETGRPLQVVLDPVVRSSSGRELLSREGLDRMEAELIPLVDWVTPNLDELRLLSGIAVETSEEVEAAVDLLQQRYECISVVGKGGHLDAADDYVALADGRREWMRGEKIASRSTHGTGCAFSTALLCGLVSGADAMVAARRAKQFVSEAIRTAPGVGHGTGPMELLWPLRHGGARGK